MWTPALPLMGTSGNLVITVIIVTAEELWGAIVRVGTSGRLGLWSRFYH